MIAVDSERLELELARLVRRRHPRAQILEIRRSPLLAPSSWAVEDVEVLLSDGSIVRLVLKDLNREAPGSDARSVKPARLLDPHRETWVYENVLGRLGESPALLGSITDEVEGVHWLLLERVTGVPLWEVGDRAAWMGAAQWLGRFHARFLDAPPGDAVLLRHDGRLQRWWRVRALALARGRADRRLETLTGLASLHRKATDLVMDDAPTLLHGEFYPANILVAEGRPEGAIVPVDWEMAGVGPPALDLAALTSGGWSEVDRVDFAAAYAGARREAGAPCPPLERLLASVDAARLLLAVQWLGWSGDTWHPPAELYTNWLEEAVRSADRFSA